MYKPVHRHVHAHVQNLSKTCRFNLFMSTYVCCYEHPSWTVLVPSWNPHDTTDVRCPYHMTYHYGTICRTIFVPYVVPFSNHISYHFRTILSPDHTIFAPFCTMVSPDRTVFVPFYPPDVPFSYHLSTESTSPPWMSVDDIMTIDDFMRLSVVDITSESRASKIMWVANELVSDTLITTNKHYL